MCCVGKTTNYAEPEISCLDMLRIHLPFNDRLTLILHIWGLSTLWRVHMCYVFFIRISRSTSISLFSFFFFFFTYLSYRYILFPPVFLLCKHVCYLTMQKLRPCPRAAATPRPPASPHMLPNLVVQPEAINICWNRCHQSDIWSRGSDNCCTLESFKEH